MGAIWSSVQAMPNSSMWWPIILMGLWCLVGLWPRRDGGGIGYALAAVAPAWFTLGPIALVWIVWAALVAIFGG